MRDMPLLAEVVSNEALTRGLGDPEARILVEWLVERVEMLLATDCPPATARADVQRLSRRGRAISRFVHLWCHQGARKSAVQLAGAERFTWPLPTMAMDPCELMHEILVHEAEQLDLPRLSRAA